MLAFWPDGGLKFCVYHLMLNIVKHIFMIIKKTILYLVGTWIKFFLSLFLLLSLCSEIKSNSELK